MSKQAASDYTWSYTEEPHRSRRKEILSKHPEVKDLFGFDPRSRYWVLLSVAIQFAVAYLLKDQSWWVITIVAYVVGGTINHSLNLAGHELAHNLFFDNPVHNTLFGFIANLPMVLAVTVYVSREASFGQRPFVSNVDTSSQP
jgi:sphingolipid delta-4 desaturase